MKFMRYLCVLFLMTTLLFAQEDSIDVDLAKEGLFIYLSDQAIGEKSPTPEGAVEIRLLRSTNAESSFDEIAEVRMSDGPEEFLNEVGRDIEQIDQSSIDSTWQYILDNPYLENYGMALLNPNFVTALGAAYLDKNVNMNETYFYKAEYLNTEGEIVKSAFSASISPADKPNIARPILSNYYHTDSTATLFWDAEELADEESFFADVFIQTNSQGDFNKYGTPSVKGITDSSYQYKVRLEGLVEKTLYKVYLRPRTNLNVYGPRSDTVAFFAVDYNQIPLMGEAQAEATDIGIKLSWEKLKDEPYFTGIVIARTEDASGRYIPIDTVNNSVTSYIDKNVQSGSTYYYKLKPVVGSSVDLPYQAYAESEFIGNELIVLPPKNLTAKIDHGIIKLNWTEPDSSTYGYNIYRGQSLSNSLDRINSVTGNSVYYDTTDFLSEGEDYVYAVTSITGQNNESDYSNRVSVKIPIRSKPEAPVEFTGYEEGYRIKLVWNDVSTSDKFVVGYNLYKQINDENFKKINSQLLESNVYNDPNIQKGNNYSYYVTSVNSASLESKPSFEKNFSVSETKLSPPTKLNARSLVNGIEISWNRVLDERVTDYKLYKKTPGESWQLISEVGPNNKTYIDKNVDADKLYSYAVSVISKEGESNMSRQTSERFDP